MADVTKATSLDFDADSLMRCVIIKGDDIKAGEAITRGDVCFIDSDGLVYKATYEDGFVGLSYADYAAGNPVTLIGAGGICSYGASMTPGASLYLSDTAGALGTAGIVDGEDTISILAAVVLEDDRILIK